MSTRDDYYPFGRSDYRSSIKCLGCKREFPDIPRYNAHDCPQPNSGEAYK